MAHGVPPPDDGVEFFEKKIRPVLVAECYECHNVTKRKGGLALDHRAGWEKGGESGPALERGKPEVSLLLKSIRHEDPDLKMPKKAPKLDERVIADFDTWVRMGAPDPRDQPEPLSTTKNKSWTQTLADRKTWWSFQPVQNPPLPAVKDTGWSRASDRSFCPREPRGERARSGATGRCAHARPPAQLCTHWTAAKARGC
jgi:hypothetical protein